MSQRIRVAAMVLAVILHSLHPDGSRAKSYGAGDPLPAPVVVGVLHGRQAAAADSLCTLERSLQLSSCHTTQ